MRVELGVERVFDEFVVRSEAVFCVELLWCYGDVVRWMPCSVECRGSSVCRLDRVDQHVAAA